MPGRYRVVQRIGDELFQVGDPLLSEAAAILAAADLTVNYDAEIDVFVVGPGGAVGIGVHDPGE